MTAPDQTPSPNRSGDVITLANPVAHHFPAFIFGNATKCDAVCEGDSKLGKTVAICGAGPTLADTAADYVDRADEVWGCNSALTYLADRGLRVTHGFTVDQTPAMVNEWASAPDVEYLVASTIHPHLTEALLAAGRRLRFFHNYVGIPEGPVAYEGHIMPYEDWMYAALFPPTVRCGSGLNATTRAIDLAFFMGFDKVWVLGADCALKLTAPRPRDAITGSRRHRKWLERHVIMHADGGNALTSGATPITLEAEIDGRHWETKPDMAITAVALVKMLKKLAPRLELVGDTLPNAIKDKPEAFYDRMPSLIDASGNVVPLG